MGRLGMSCMFLLTEEGSQPSVLNTSLIHTAFKVNDYNMTDHEILLQTLYLYLNLNNWNNFCHFRVGLF